MLNIYAHSLLTATRANTVELRDMPPKSAQEKRHWLPAARWWLRTERGVNMFRL